MVPRHLATIQPSTLWLQVWSLAAVQGAMSLSWLFYGLYLPDLLTQMGLSPSLGPSLLVVENLLAIVVEPIMGGLSDRAQYWVGTRLPMITAGVIAAACLFMGIPAIVVFGKPEPIFQGMVLVAMVGWALAMATFRSPVLCLLGKYAMVPNLPQAASVLTFVGGLVGALRPLASTVILGWGAGVAFTIASLSLLGATAVLRQLHPIALVTPELSTRSPNLSQNPPLELSTSHLPASPSQSLPLIGLVFLFMTGVGNAWGIRFLLGEIMPSLLKLGLPGQPLPLLMGIASILLGIIAIPMGIVATALGNRLWMLTNLLLAVVFLGAAMVIRQPLVAIIVILLLLSAASVILNGVIPFVLSVMPPQQGGLGIGMYFSGFTAGITLLTSVLPRPSELSMVQQASMAIVAFLIAYLGVRFSRNVSDY